MKKLPALVGIAVLALIALASVCLDGCQASSPTQEQKKDQYSPSVDSSMNMDKSGSVGLSIMSDGSKPSSGKEVSLKFKLTDIASGKTIIKLETTHGKPLHFVVVDESLTDFQHLHPAMANEGTWTQNVMFPSGGRYLLFADGKAGGSGFAARQEIQVDGPPRKATSDFKPNDTSTVGSISATIIDPNTLNTGSESMVRLKLSRPDGWQPYLEAPGHLIIIRKEGDEFIHAHPAKDLNDGVVEFMAAFKKPGIYRAWAQFQREDKVLTFPFTISVGTSTGTGSKPMDMEHTGH